MTPCDCPQPCPHAAINAALSQENERLRWRLGVTLAALARLDPDATTIDNHLGDVSPTPAQSARILAGLREAIAALPPPADDPDATARRLVTEALGEE